MTAEATNSPKRTLDCGAVATEDLLEKYLTGGLSEQEREAVEEHYFACQRCFDQLQTLQAIREELRRPEATSTWRPRRFAGWAAGAGIAASIVLGTTVMLWMRPSVSDTVVTPTREPSARAAPSEAPASIRTASGDESKPSIDQLARFEPPPYKPLTLRGPTDEAASRFRAGMERYRTSDYAGAVAQLRAAAALDPDAPHIRFFLGVSNLMLGEDTAAIRDLRATIDLGDSPFLEDAHFYLAKAYLRRHDIQGATAHFKAVIQLGESRRVEARQLLSDVQRLKEH